MEKIWYIYSENHHKGPFSADEIFKMFHSDFMNEKSLVWREGLQKWVYLCDCDELWDIISPRPSLPELPIEEIPLFSPIDEPTSTDEEDEIPSLPVEALEVDVKPAQEISELKIKRRIPWGWLATGIVCCIIFAYFLGNSRGEKAPEWSNLSILESERLKNISEVRLREGVKVGLAASPREMRVYFASNRSGPAVVTLQLKSQPKRILGPDLIEASAEGKMEGHFLVFDSFKFSSGNRFIPGYYKVELAAVSFHPQRQILNQLIDWGILSKEGYSEKFVYKGELLIADVPASRFNQDLNDYVTKVEEEKIFPYLDLKERYSTLLSFADQLFIFFQNQVLASKEGFDQANFVKVYSVELGHLFQVFVEDTQKNRVEVTSKVPTLASDFDELNLIAENLGDLVGAMKMKFQKKADMKSKKIHKKERQELVDYFTPKFDKIKNDLKLKLGVLEQKIINAKKSLN